MCKIAVTFSCIVQRVRKRCGKETEEKKAIKKGSVFTNEIATNDEISRLDERDNDLVLNDILNLIITISKFSNLIGHQQA